MGPVCLKVMLIKFCKIYQLSYVGLGLKSTFSSPCCFLFPLICCVFQCNFFAYDEEGCTAPVSIFQHCLRNVMSLKMIKMKSKHFCQYVLASSSSRNAFVSGAGDQNFESRAGQIGHSVANGLPLLRHFFVKSCVDRAQ